MKLIAILALIATCLAVATEAQQTTLKPSTPKSATLKTTTPKSATLKTTTPNVKVASTTRTATLKAASGSITTTMKPTVKTTLKPAVTSTVLKSTIKTPQPTAKPTTLKPTVTSTTLKPTFTTTTLKPTVTSATLKPTVSSTTLKPTVTTTTLKPTVTSTTLKPTFKSTTLRPTVTSTTLKPNITSTTLKPTFTSTSLKPTVTSTTLKPTVTSTTLKPTITTTNLRPTVTSTTLKPIGTTTIRSTGQNVSTTTLKPTIISKYFVCRDTNSTAATGSIQLDRNSTNSLCSFDIIAPSDQQIQIFCSSLNSSIAASSSLSIYGDLDNYDWQLVLNRVYYSVNNTLSLVYSKVSNEDSFNCNWTRSPKEITANSKLCRHAEATTANGIIQSFSGDTGPERSCSFLIKALPDQQIKISCSFVNFSSNSYSTHLSIDGTLDDSPPYSPVNPPSNQRFQFYNYYTPPVLNRIYYSSGNNLTISSVFSNNDSFVCNWTTIPKEITTNSKVCRHAQASTINGTIRPLESDGGPPRTCFFSVNVLPSQRIQISCSDYNLTNQNGYLNFLRITEMIPSYPGPVLNRIYYSIDNNAYVISRFGQGNSFTCNWTAVPKENTTSLQFCRHGFASMMNGTITPFTGIATGETRQCQFLINATSDYQIQISCPFLNLSEFGSLSIKGVADENVNVVPVPNRTYYSAADNQVTLTAKVSNTDWFSCGWKIVPKEITSDNKLCHHTAATTANGTIQPLIIGAAEPPRQCSFVISSTTDEQIQISCSNVSADSSLSIYGTIDYAAPPVVNRVYTSQKYYNQIRIFSTMSGVSNRDWFNCKWAITSRENTTDNKLCVNAEATTTNGTIQPIAADTGPPRQCYFTISSSPDQKIQISCSVVNTTSSSSYLRIYGAVYMDFPPIVNRVYTSTSYGKVFISSELGNGDWINCKWSTTPRKNTAEAQFCNDEQATSANGTISNVAGDTGPPRWCSFSISALHDKQIQISCSVVNLTSASSYISISGSFSGDSIRPVVNQMYYSTADNYIQLASNLVGEDVLHCEWFTIAKEITTESKLCRHTEATAANGTIQPLVGDTAGSRKCSFFINAPNDQQIQMSCSVVNLTNSNSYFEINGAIDYASPPVLNRVYTSSMYNQISINSQLGNGDWVSCNWTTTPRMNTTNNKLCQNGEATTPNGIIEPLVRDAGPQRSCSFSINAPNDQQIKMSCSVVNLTNSNSYFEINGALDYASPPVLNRVYTSSTYNQIYINSQLGNGDWVSCNWTTTPRKNTTNNKLCQNSEATTPNGIIESLVGDAGPQRSCSFAINAPRDQRIQIFCSNVTLNTTAGSSLFVGGIIEYAYPPVSNRVYTSLSSNHISINSVIGDEDWISCNWTTTPKKNTTESKLCRDELATSANGTIQPLVGDMGPPRSCPFIITAVGDQEIQMSCSAVNLTESDVYIISGAMDQADPPILNRVYTSIYNEISIFTLLSYTSWINCKWTTTPRKNTTDNKLCHHRVATTANGTIQPIAGDTGPLRQCYFTINAPYDQKIQISCSIVSLTDPNSYFTISGAIDYASPPLLNRVYTSSAYNEIYINSQLGNEDWVSCNWTTTTRKNTTNNKLCENDEATTPNGIIEPLVGDVGLPRACPFTITAPNDQQIQISCSFFNLTFHNSYLSIYGIVDSSSVVVNPPIVNRVYYSATSNPIIIYSRLDSTEWISCNWTTSPKANTTNYKFCRDDSAISTLGTITPIVDDLGPSRECAFYLTLFTKIQISCSVVNLTNPGSYLKFISFDGGPTDFQPEVNAIYTYSYASFQITSNFGDGDFFDCKWKETP